MLTVKKLPGFRDFFTQDIQVREFVISTFKKIFEKYGYEPLETPALEYASIFSSESGQEAEKLFFKFKDQGNRDIMLKYEVMISMCRAVAENFNNIQFPFKRYQVQPVWRAERPQKGRFREFTQCDADTIGSSSVIWDAEFIQMGIEALEKLNFNKFKVNISNRKFLNGLIIYAGAEQKDFIPICMSIDKLPKIGKEAVYDELINKKNISKNIVNKILDAISYQEEFKKLLVQYKKIMSNIDIAITGLNELEIIYKYLKLLNIDEEKYCFAPYIARGLAYYTGPVWEFEITDGQVGSIAGCGRYDDTIGHFLGKKIPATGGSFGIERIVQIIQDRNMYNIQTSKTKILVTIFNPDLFDYSIKIADYLRKNQINTMLYSDPDKLDKQLKYADKKGIPYVIIAGPNEYQNNTILLKHLPSKIQFESRIEDILSKIK
jgi:histidyl-tRNA synthetase